LAGDFGLNRRHECDRGERRKGAPLGRESPCFGVGQMALFNIATAINFAWPFF
jgi:hypothetical protein